MSFTFVDLCAGIGGARHALEKIGLKCRNYSEIDEKAIVTYKALYNEDHNGLNDLRNISASDIQDVDLLTAGFPCQSYSIVGKRAGLADPRGQIIFAIADILNKSQIPYFIFENVKGILNSNKGRDFELIMSLLSNAGYNVKYQLLNSINYGVPQSRERVYFVGIRKDLPHSNFKFPIGKKYIYDLSKIFTYKNIIQQGSRQYATFIRYLDNKYNSGKFDTDEILSEDNLVLDTRQSDLRLYRGFVPTIRKGRQGILYVYDKNIYSLSKEEALLCQGFSKELFTNIEHINTNTILAQVGNAMTVNVIEAIAANLLPIMHQNLAQKSVIC